MESFKLNAAPDQVTTVTVNYVHGHGLNVRSAVNPVATAEDFLRMLDHYDMRCEHSLPLIWIFTGIWPKKNKTYTFITADQHAASRLLTEPHLIRMMGDPGDLVAVDPVTGDGMLALVEHNEWMASHFGEGNNLDFSGLAEGAESVENFLRGIAEGNNNQEGT